MRIFILAGEPSGDKLGADLMASLKARVPDVAFFGIGGDCMMAQGLDPLFPMEEIAIMGITEILKEYSNLKARIRETADVILREKPDLVITIDLPEFSLRVNKLVRAQSDIRIVHYVAPSVWAWRPGRAKKMAPFVDQVLALLPFEPPYMEAEGMRCDFVGHPIVADPVATQAEADVFRAEIGAEGREILLVLPGSRRSEISRMAPVFGETLAKMVQSRPNVTWVLPAAASVAGEVRQAIADWPVDVIFIDPNSDPEGTRKRAAFKAADGAIATSGTVSLELAASNTPMVIAFKTSWLTQVIIKPMLRVASVNLVNLVADTTVIPEFLGKDCEPDHLATAMCEILDEPEVQRDAMQLCMARLGQGGDKAPGDLAAEAVLDGFARSKSKPEI